MFAHVYPLKRTPRRFTFFDYKIPEGMTVKVGDLVEIPFKQSHIYGVVGEVTTQSKIPRLRDIFAVAEPGFLSEKDVRRLLCIAKNIIQSPATIFYSALGAYKARTGRAKLIQSQRALSIDAETASFIGSTIAQLTDSAFVQLSAEGEYALAALMRKKKDGQILLIFPREQDANRIANTLALGDVAVLHGKTTTAERDRIMQGWRNGSIQTLIGTKQAALIPAQNIEYIQIFDNASEDYRKLDRNPRIDARNATALLARQHDALLVYSGVTPRLSLVKTAPLFWRTPESSNLISLRAPDEQSVVPFFSSSLQKAVELALQRGKNVLLSFNRKGVADRIQCNSCGHLPTCGNCGSFPSVREHDLICQTCKTEMWIPEQCPSCGQKKIRKKGLGNKELSHQLQTLFPKARVGIIDKDHQDLDADIILATEYFFKNTWHPFFEQTFGVMADLSIDMALIGSDFRNNEDALYKFHRLQAIAKQQHATCIVQTWIPDFIQPFQKPAEFLQKELRVREAYSLPPHIERYELMSSEQPLKHKKATQQNIQALFNTPDTCIIHPERSYYDCPSRPSSPR